MANFKIAIDPKGSSVRLELSGNFDGTSADELLNVIRTYGDGAEKIFINTRNLRTVHPFGMALFRNKFYTVKQQSDKLVFSDEKWERMISRKNEPSWVNI